MFYIAQQMNVVTNEYGYHNNILFEIGLHGLIKYLTKNNNLYDQIPSFLLVLYLICEVVERLNSILQCHHYR